MDRSTFDVGQRRKQKVQNEYNLKTILYLQLTNFLKILVRKMITYLIIFK